MSCMQAAGKQLLKHMSGEYVLGIDGQNHRAGQLTLEQTARAATAAFNRVLQVRHLLLRNLYCAVPAMFWTCSVKFKNSQAQTGCQFPDQL